MSNSSGSVVPLFGRILISPVYILSGIFKVAAFSMMTGVVAAAHLPLPKVSLACAAAIEILGGLAILTGFHTKLAAWIVFLFMIPTTFLFHNFWTMQGADFQNNMSHFEKNLAIMGGLLILATFGAGAYSIDSARAPKS
ncbi:MAG TPA: DoxX family protein [Candidatus Acidoferrales bacterium]|nr:DoxX family protein [Candidatus Acidoferrales bacterium]